LAHGSPTVKLGGFSNVRELYQKIADSFNIPFSEVRIGVNLYLLFDLLC